MEEYDEMMEALFESGGKMASATKQKKNGYRRTICSLASTRTSWGMVRGTC